MKQQGGTPGYFYPIPIPLHPYRKISPTPLGVGDISQITAQAWIWGVEKTYEETKSTHPRKNYTMKISSAMKRERAPSRALYENYSREKSYWAAVLTAVVNRLIVL